MSRMHMHECVECGVQVNAAVQQMQNAASVANKQRAPPSVSARSPGGGRVSTDAPPSSTDSPSHVHGRTSLTSTTSQAGEDDVESAAIAERTRMLLLQPSFCDRVPSEKLTPHKLRSSLAKSLTMNTSSTATPSALQWPSICIDDGMLFTQGHDAEQDQLVQYAPHPAARPRQCVRSMLFLDSIVYINHFCGSQMLEGHSLACFRHYPAALHPCDPDNASAGCIPDTLCSLFEFISTAGR